jgi:GNAT superfamily N-acetyltransferase
MRIRECRASDRRSLDHLGHFPGVIETLGPTRFTRLAWAIHRTRVLTFVVEDPASGALTGSVQFVRSRIDRGTWMFGHWRVSPDRRGEGIGGALLRGALQRVPGVTRLYSLIEPENEASIRAHDRLGFERSSRYCGGGPLGLLSTIGPPTPAVRLQRVTRRDRRKLFGLYQSAMGSLWGRLFPGLLATRFLHAADEPPDLARPRSPSASIPDRVMLVQDSDERPAFLVRSRRQTCLFSNPERCEAGLVARVASRLLALGAGREEWLTLRGLPRSLARKPGQIRSWVLMGTTDLGRLRRDG